jgi:hypothetical protein
MACRPAQAREPSEASPEAFKAPEKYPGAPEWPPGQAQEADQRTETGL